LSGKDWAACCALLTSDVDEILCYDGFRSAGIAAIVALTLALKALSMNTIWANINLMYPLLGFDDGQETDNGEQEWLVQARGRLEAQPEGLEIIDDPY
jgi:hypothetical protein